VSFDKQFWTPFGFSLNDVSLGDVQRRLGSAQSFEVPEGHHERAICYLSMDESTVVVFSSGELGGGTQLLGVSLELASLRSYSCSKPAADLPATFPMGLHVGMSEQEFLKTAGVPFERVTFTTLRRFADLKRTLPTAESEKRYGDKETSRLIQENGGMDGSQAFWVTLRDGRVVALSVWKEETF
jgi:hypothetical protein